MLKARAPANRALSDDLFHDLCYDGSGERPPYQTPEGVLRILLSYNEADSWLTTALRASLFLSSPNLDVVLSPDPDIPPPSFRSKRIDLRNVDGLLLVAGPNGVTSRQQAEWTAATSRTEHDDKFVLLPVLAGQSAPPPEDDLKTGEWFKAPVVTDRNMICSLVRVLESSRC